MRKCPLTDNENWLYLYESDTEKIITGDQRIVDGKLEKVICKDCGIVSNKNEFSESEIEKLYGEEYELNTLGKEEHFFFTNDGISSRSAVFFEWVRPFVTNEFRRIIEIGCGEGNLLKRFSEHFPEKEIIGIDGSKRASDLAKAKGLNVERQLIFGHEILPESDVFLLVNVIEHIEDLESIFSLLKRSLNDNGIIIFCLPIQDYGGYDLFFQEHVWHFTSFHFKSILLKNGLEVIHEDCNHPVNHGIGLFVCKPSKVDFSYLITKTDICSESLKFWISKFVNVNQFLLQNRFEKIAIFGAGEVATLFLAFSNLGKVELCACIDDTRREGEFKHGIPIYHSKWLHDNNVDLLLLTVNDKYTETIKNNFSHLDINIKSIYECQK